MNENVENLFRDILTTHFREEMNRLKIIHEDDDLFDDYFESEFQTALSTMRDHQIPQYIQDHATLSPEEKKMAFDLLDMCKKDPEAYKERVKLEIKILCCEE